MALAFLFCTCAEAKITGDYIASGGCGFGDFKDGKQSDEGLDAPKDLVYIQRNSLPMQRDND
jgi:hypothetical protein